MNTKETKYYDIVGGPSRDTLFDACKYVYDPDSNVGVTFEISIPCEIPPESGASYCQMNIKNIWICSIEHEDGSGRRFNLKGYCDAELREPHFGKTEWKPYKFGAFYNANTRKGTIAFTS